MSYAVGVEQRTVERWQVNWGRLYNHSVAFQMVRRRKGILDVKENLLRIDCSSETRNHP